MIVIYSCQQQTEIAGDRLPGKTICRRCLEVNPHPQVRLLLNSITLGLPEGSGVGVVKGVVIHALSSCGLSAASDLNMGVTTACAAAASPILNSNLLACRDSLSDIEGVEGIGVQVYNSLVGGAVIDGDSRQAVAATAALGDSGNLTAGQGVDSIAVAALEVGAGELAVCLAGGIPLFYAISKTKPFKY